MSPQNLVWPIGDLCCISNTFRMLISPCNARFCFSYVFADQDQRPERLKHMFSKIIIGFFSFHVSYLSLQDPVLVTLHVFISQFGYVL